ncbi:hypothetical protein SAMN05444671_1025 [Flavobacterium sp. CF108]|nr:hypothetical protein SAMN04487978_0701 [Flavobacterium sp. fv08]SHG63426.1 hypothetical protein SAMN05444671_1025 [Flavobacterium sp. CF108]
MIKSKLAFIIFLILLLILFPYYIIYLQSDYLSSMIPGWHTDFVSGKATSSLIKSIILFITTICYWKLSKITGELNLKKFLIHFLMTFPAVFIGRLNVFELLDLHSLDADSFVNLIQIIVFINICINILFFAGQILFGLHYQKLKKQLR